MAPFSEGDVVEFITRSKGSARVVRATVNWVERRPEGWYFGYTPTDWRNGAWGAAMLFDVPHPYGLQTLRVVGASSVWA